MYNKIKIYVLRILSSAKEDNLIRIPIEYCLANAFYQVSKSIMVNVWLQGTCLFLVILSLFRYIKVLLEVIIRLFKQQNKINRKLLPVCILFSLWFVVFSFPQLMLDIWRTETINTFLLRIIYLFLFYRYIGCTLRRFIVLPSNYEVRLIITLIVYFIITSMTLFMIGEYDCRIYPYTNEAKEVVRVFENSIWLGYLEMVGNGFRVVTDTFKQEEIIFVFLWWSGIFASSRQISSYLDENKM